eukprot:gene18321-24010_t
MSSFPINLLYSYSHNDPKLKGFSSVTRLLTNNPDDEKYLIASGKGIKNVHIWQFDPVSDTKWMCLYDLPTNGITIECISFRNNGKEFFTKSSGSNLRLWNISSSQLDSQSKPTYDDIANSGDVIVALDNFAFGGAYSFAMVRIDAPKSANRDIIQIPERSSEDENGNRRKRLMRQIDKVLGTKDSIHILALCTDGGVMYFHNNTTTLELIELSSIQRDPDIDSVWAMNRVGLYGDVVLMRAEKSNCRKYTTIYVDLLLDIASQEIKSTRISKEEKSWNDWGYYMNKSSIDVDKPVITPSNDVIPTKPPIYKPKSNLPKTNSKLLIVFGAPDGHARVSSNLTVVEPFA